MKNLFIIANWKSNKDISESKEWIQKVLSIKNEILSIENIKIIICPPFTLLSDLKLSLENNLSFELGAQDISPYDAGAYTGEVNGKQISDFADYVIVGHSERRKNFGEDEEMINQKLEIAQKYNLTPIFCVSELSQIQNLKVKSLIVAYEPLFAIGTGQADTPENADLMASSIKKELGDIPVLYGGSINSENVHSFTKMGNIDGVLVGSASLDPLEFLKIIKNA